MECSLAVGWDDLVAVLLGSPGASAVAVHPRLVDVLSLVYVRSWVGHSFRSDGVGLAWLAHGKDRAGKDDLVAWRCWGDPYSSCCFI